MSYTVAASHPIDLSSGAVRAPGDTVPKSALDLKPVKREGENDQPSHDAALIESGLLAEAKATDGDNTNGGAA